MLAWLVLGLVIGAFALVCLVVFLAQRFIPHPIRAKHNDVAGFVYAVLGVMFAVTLGFVVVNEWEALTNSKNNTFAEANELGALYWNARALPAAQGRDLERTTKEYAEVVINREWPMLNSGGSSSEATDLVYRMRDEINALPTGSRQEQILYDQSLQHVNNLAAARRERLNQSSDEVPAVLWVALILGTVLTVGYMFLFGVSDYWAHVLIAAPLTILVVLALAVIAVLDHPFGGIVSTQPEAFHVFLARLPPQRP